MTTVIATYQDSVDALVDYCGAGPSDQVIRDIRRAIVEAYREIPNVHKWPYLIRHGRIITQAPYDGVDHAGTNPRATIAYLHSSGARPRQVTLSGATWPDWAAAGYIRVAAPDGLFNFQLYRVDQLVSANVLTLDDELNPGSDIAPGATFTLYQDSYLLPADLISQDQPFFELNLGGMAYVQPSEWLFDNRYLLSAGSPYCYAVTGDRQYPGRLVMRLAPWPIESRTIDFNYLRRPRPLNYQMASGGLVTITNGGVSVTCTTPSFTSAMVGSIIRVSASTKAPSAAIGSVGGYNPAVLEATIRSFVSPTVVTTDTPAPQALTGVNWYVSDPIDFEQGAMLTAFQRCCEARIAKLRTLKDKQGAQGDYLVALDQGRSASRPSYAGQCAGPQFRARRRLRDMGPLIRD